MGARSDAAAHDATADHFFGGIQKFVIRTLGNRADLISNGDALVEVQVPAKVPLNKVKVTLNGKDVSAVFAVADATKRTLRGVVTGLRIGHNLLRVDATTRGSDLWGFLHGFDDDASLIITNHPRGGPILLRLADDAVDLRHAGGSAGQRRRAGNASPADCRPTAYDPFSATSPPSSSSGTAPPRRPAPTSCRTRIRRRSSRTRRPMLA